MPARRDDTHYAHLDLPDSVKLNMKKLQDSLWSKAKELKHVAADPDHGHITLGYFILDRERRSKVDKCKQTDENVAVDIRQLIAKFMKNKLKNLYVVLGGLGSFHTTVIYVKVHKTPKLFDLRKEIVAPPGHPRSSLALL
ncbi:uncharacterized protein [Procambarus clarkii]|uniref:uncharacterized protein n=1 Tax=Procambarus clarkii TaxID=6728 RepID=UPI003741F5FF